MWAGAAVPLAAREEFGSRVGDSAYVRRLIAVDSGLSAEPAHQQGLRIDRSSVLPVAESPRTR